MSDRPEPIDYYQVLVQLEMELAAVNLRAANLRAAIAGVVRLIECDEEEARGGPVTVKEAGRRGGRKGGEARAAKLSPARRSEIAQKAAAARWGSPEPPTPDKAQL
jgi:hypothetical protein